MNTKEKTTKSNKEKLIVSLVKSKGIVSMACDNCDIDRKTYYNYYNEDAEFKALADDVQEIAIDFVESKLFQKINGLQMGKVVDGETIVYEKEPSDTAIIFYLKTKAKHRGYVERQEVTGKDGNALFESMSDKELEKKIEQLRKV